MPTPGGSCRPHRTTAIQNQCITRSAMKFALSTIVTDTWPSSSEPTDWVFCDRLTTDPVFFCVGIKKENPNNNHKKQVFGHSFEVKNPKNECAWLPRGKPFKLPRKKGQTRSKNANCFNNYFSFIELRCNRCVFLTFSWVNSCCLLEQFMGLYRRL